MPVTRQFVVSPFDGLVRGLNILVVFVHIKYLAARLVPTSRWDVLVINMDGEPAS